MSNSGPSVKLDTDFLIAVIIGFILLFYWPAPLRHQYSPTKAGIVRIDRISGDTSILMDGKYVPVNEISEDVVNLGPKR